MSEPLKHDDRMPFGRYVGYRMGDVPESYLRWFLNQPWCDHVVTYANEVVEDD